MDKGLDPSFKRATGLVVQGEGHGAVAAARMIRDKLRSADISADPAVNVSIETMPAAQRRSFGEDSGLTAA